MGYRDNKHLLDEVATAASEETVSSASDRIAKIAVCGDKEGYLSYFTEDPAKIGCIKCANAVDKAAYDALYETFITLGDPVKTLKGTYRDFKSNTPILRNGEVVGYIRLDNGWGKKDWHIDQLAVWKGGHSYRDDEEKAQLNTSRLEDGFRSKWAALLWADANSDKLWTEAEAWVSYKERTKADAERRQARFERDEEERGELDRQIEVLENMRDLPMIYNLGNSHIDALQAALKLMWEARDNV